MPRLTKKGQVTIPKPIRQALGVSAGDNVEFLVTKDRQVVLVKSPSGSPFAKYTGYLSNKAGQDPDRIVAELRGDAG